MLSSGSPVLSFGFPVLLSGFPVLLFVLPTHFIKAELAVELFSKSVLIWS